MRGRETTMRGRVTTMSGDEAAKRGDRMIYVLHNRQVVYENAAGGVHHLLPAGAATFFSCGTIWEMWRLKNFFVCGFRHPRLVFPSRCFGAPRKKSESPLWGFGLWGLIFSLREDVARGLPRAFPHGLYACRNGADAAMHKGCGNGGNHS